MKVSTRRTIMTVVGVIVCSSAIAAFMHSGFGVDPFQCASRGIYRPFSGITSYGTFYMIWSFLLLLADLVLDRKQIGVATFAHLFLTGYVVDGSVALLERLIPAPGLAMRIILLLGGIVIMCIGASLYFTSAQGVSVYDAIANGISGKKPRIFNREIPFRVIRIFTDVVCVLVGLCFGVIPGIGTVISALFMGPLIDWFSVHLARPLLNGK